MICDTARVCVKAINIPFIAGILPIWSDFLNFNEHLRACRTQKELLFASPIFSTAANQVGSTYSHTNFSHGWVKTDIIYNAIQLLDTPARKFATIYCTMH